MDAPRHALELGLGHLHALYRFDVRGRILGWNEALGGVCPQAPPRLHQVRTPLGNLWRLRADLDRRLVVRLAGLLAREAPLGELLSGAPPAAPLPEPQRAEFIRRALAEAGPLVSERSGLLWRIAPAAQALRPAGRVVRLVAADASRLHPGLRERHAAAIAPRAAARVRAGAAGTGGAGALAFGIEQDGAIVALCRGVDASARRAGGAAPGPSQRGPAPFAEAIVETAAAHRGRGFGRAVLRAWAQDACERGRSACFATPWCSAPARALAAGLSAQAWGEDRTWR